MSEQKPVKTFLRDDRQAIINFRSGLEDTLGFIDTMLLQEKYGLSVIFREESLEFVCEDPDKLARGAANTPAGSIYCWLSWMERKRLLDTSKG